MFKSIEMIKSRIAVLEARSKNNSNIVRKLQREVRRLSANG